MSTLRSFIRLGGVLSGLAASVGSLRANDILWQSLVVPTTATGGTTLQITAVVTNNSEEDEWGGDHYLALRNATGNVVALASLDGVGVGQTVTRAISYGLPNVTGPLTFTLQALEHNNEYFGDIHTRTVAVTATPPYLGVSLSATTFDALAPARISTTDTVTDSPAYRLRAKIIDGTAWGWHAANQWNLSNYPLDNPPPPGNYATCALYWVRYTSLYGTVLEVGPERRESISVSGSVTLSSNWFHASSHRSRTDLNQTLLHAKLCGKHA